MPAAERLRQAQALKTDVDHGKSQAAIARELGVTRARVTQLMKLLELSPDIQDFILSGENGTPVLTERSLRPLLAMSHEKQLHWVAREWPGFAEHRANN